VAGSPYAITQGTVTNANNPNYTITFIGANLTITARPITVTANAQTKVYGEGDPVLTFTTSSLGTGAAVAGVLARDAGETVAGSPYAITQGTVTDANNPNYTITFVGANLTITARPITVTANAQTKVYGDGDPALTFTTSSLGTGVAVTGVLSRDAGETVAGSPYAITQGTVTNANNPNYAITFVGANLTITKADTTTTVLANNAIWNGAPHGGTASWISVEADAEGGPLPVSYVGRDGTVYPSSTTAPTSVGKYTASASFAGNLNHNASSGSANYEITTGYCFGGFLSPIGGSVEAGTGGTFADPVRAFKLGSTIPIKFILNSWNGSTCGAVVTTGVHTLQATYYSSALDSDQPVDASPTDAATTGSQFRLTGTEWHFNLSTKGGVFKAGTWLLKATLQDGSVKTVWITIKK
jgi:hypothetical protein